MVDWVLGEVDRALLLKFQQHQAWACWWAHAHLCGALKHLASWQHTVLPILSCLPLECKAFVLCGWVQVIRCALENAASVAKTFLTSDVSAAVHHAILCGSGLMTWASCMTQSMQSVFPVRARSQFTIHNSPRPP